MHVIHRTTLALAALVAVAPAFAQQGQEQGHGQPPSPEQRAQRMMEHMSERFNAADANHDGKLTLDEARAGMPMVARNFDQIDTAHTGGITLDQLTAFAKSHQRPHGMRGGQDGAPAQQ